MSVSRGGLGFGLRLACLAAVLLPATPSLLAQDEIFEVDFNPGGNRVVVFARNANGDVASIRSFTSIFFAAPDGVALDAVHGELFLSDQGPSVLMFPRGTSGSVYPSRFIYGALTLLSTPYSIAVDPFADELYVADVSANAIRVFARTANGNVPPLRSIVGPTTTLNGPRSVRIDRLHGEIAVVHNAGVSFFAVGADGDQAPLRTIPLSGADDMEIDAVHDEVLVSVPGSPAIRAYSRTDGTPLRTIAGGNTGFDGSCGFMKLGLDLYNNEVTTSRCGSSTTRGALVFSRTADGDVAPLRTIAGTNTTMNFVFGVAIGKTEVLPQSPLLVDYAAGATSNGNGVLEPGETALIAPAWNNQTAAGVPLTGTLSNFTGPGTATYGIPVPSADYGTLAAGTTGTCQTGAQCSSISLSVPATRPSQHWDATVWETPSTGNTVAVWHLHIGNSFSDVPASSGFYRFVETIFHNGVTGGCGAGTFCPGNPATRAQMAVFLLLSREGLSYVPPAATGTLFSDVPASSGFAKWIEELANRGVTAGCGGGLYCPNDPVTRAQMAVFLLVAKEGSAYAPPPAVGLFNDVPASNGFAKWIEELAHRGITAGCGNGNYCPGLAITRAQMAVFLTTTFSLGLNGL